MLGTSLRLIAVLLSVSLMPYAGRPWAQPSSELRVDDVDTSLTRILQYGLWDAERGAWRTKVQLMIEPSTRLLQRRTITIWDPMPSRGRAFTWVPANGVGLDKEIASGEGHLIWRTRERPTYDLRSVVATYQGGMANGRPSGFGTFNDQIGVVYAGNWVDGNLQGSGHLKLPNGDDYEGDFLAGKPHGKGRYIDAAGEIYQGSFIEGRREGRATTILASGVSYQSYWHHGVEILESRQFRLAQTRAPVTGSPTDEDVRIGIIVNPVSRRIFKSNMGDDVGEDVARRALGYVGRNSERALEIRPDDRRLLGMWKGNTEIQLLPDEERTLPFIQPEISYGVFSLARTMLPSVELTMQVENRSTRPIQVTGAYLDVVQSTTDRQPAIQVSIGDDNMCGDFRYHEDYSPRVNFENYGWGPAQNARIRYSFVDPSSNLRPSDFTNSRPIGSIDTMMTVNFEADLKTLGVDTSRLAKGERFNCEYSGMSLVDERSCLRQLLGTGIFGQLAGKVRITADDPNALREPGSLITGIAGTLEYDWTDAAGTVHHRTSPFRQKLWLGRIQLGSECGDGASVKRVSETAIQFRLDQSAYRLPLSIRESVVAGRIVRYAVPLEAVRSSQHYFSVALQLADGRIVRSRPIDLLYFRPSQYLAMPAR